MNCRVQNQKILWLPQPVYLLGTILKKLLKNQLQIDSFTGVRIGYYLTERLLLRAATKLGQGNKFTGVCLSTRGGGYLVRSWGVNLVWSGGCVPGRHPPGPATPPDQVPLPGPGTHPPRTRYTTPPDQVPPPGYGQRAAGTHPTGMHSCFQTKVHGNNPIFRFYITLDDYYFYRSISKVEDVWIHLVLNYIGPNDGEGFELYQDGALVQVEQSRVTLDSTPGDGNVVLGKCERTYRSPFIN